MTWSDLDLINITLWKKCHAARFKTLMYETEDKQTCFVPLMCVCMLKETWQMGVNSHSSTADRAKRFERYLFKHYKLIPLVFDSLCDLRLTMKLLYKTAPDRAWIKLKIPWLSLQRPKRYISQLWLLPLVSCMNLHIRAFHRLHLHAD